MIEFLFSFIIVLLAFAGIGIGVLTGRGPIRGSCGGDEACSGACGRQCDKHEKRE